MGDARFGLLQNGRKQVQATDLGSPSRLGHRLGTVKGRFTGRAAVHKLLGLYVCSLPYSSAYRLTQGFGGQCTSPKYLLDRRSFSVQGTQDLRPLRRQLATVPLLLGMEPMRTLHIPMRTNSFSMY